MGIVKDMAKEDPIHCAFFVIVGTGFMLSMLGLAAIPVGDVRFALTASQGTFNATFPTSSSHFPDERKAIVEFSGGVATREIGFNSTTRAFENVQELGTALDLLHRAQGDIGSFQPYNPGKYRPYTPGLDIKLNGNFYLPQYEWKIVPEEMPLLWVAPIWCFLTALMVIGASYKKDRDLLLNALIFTGISASMLLLACHRTVELTYLCRTCNGRVADHGALSDGRLGPLLDGVHDPDDFADNNCPSTLQMKCDKGMMVYLSGSVMLLVCMYIFLVTIEYRRSVLASKSASLASHDSAATA